MELGVDTILLARVSIIRLLINILISITEIQNKEISKIWLHLARLLSKETKKERKNLAVKRNYFKDREVTAWHYCLP